KLIRKSFKKLLITLERSFTQLIKGAKIIVYKYALIRAYNTKLKVQIETLTKRRSRKRKRIQQGGTIEYGKASAQVAAEALAALQPLKKARHGEGHQNAQPGVRRCGNCGRTGHNARTCKQDAEESSESDESTVYIGSLFGSNDNS
ncbi:hypothetical protein K458DRAFT_299139, partial [Lentithecium fluviatile CBS 122367]